MNVLVVAAHPDDEVLGCGGTMARLADEGHDIFVCILGEGITSRLASRSDADESALDQLRNCSQRAADMLGVRQLFTHRLPDNRFDTVPILDIVKILERHVRELEPHEVYTQHGGDLNIDHQITYRATMTATRPMRDTPVKSLLAYEVPSSTDWSFGQFHPPFQPQRFVDIADTLDRKIAAMQVYESESRERPHPRAPEVLRAIATRWGSYVGLAAAECFSVVRDIR